MFELYSVWREAIGSFKQRRVVVWFAYLKIMNFCKTIKSNIHKSSRWEKTWSMWRKKRKKKQKQKPRKKKEENHLVRLKEAIAREDPREINWDPTYHILGSLGAVPRIWTFISAMDTMVRFAEGSQVSVLETHQWLWCLEKRECGWKPSSLRVNISVV